MAARTECIAGVDFGTSKVALVLVDVGRSSILLAESEPHGGCLALPDPAHREQSVEAALKALERLFARLGEKFRGGGQCGSISLRSIGLTGQMHGVLGVDGDGRAVTNLVTWQDGRGDSPGKDGKSLLRLMEERGGRRKVASGYGIVTLFDWALNRKHPDLAGFCTIADYAGMLLTGGRKPAMDPTMADSTGAFDFEKGVWDWEYIAALGIDRALFPPVSEPGAVIGGARGSRLLNPDGARAAFPRPAGTRLAGRAPVTGEALVSVSLGDNQASFIGSVRELYSSLLINVGTGSQVSFAAGSAGEAASLAAVDGYDVVLRPFVEGGVLVAGNAISGGAVYSALRGFFARAGRELFGVEIDALSGSLYERMERVARQAGDAGGLDVYPLFAGKRSAPSARGRIDGISLTNLTPANLIAGTLEGEVRILKEMVSERALGKLETLVGSGNGIRRNALLRSEASRLFGKELRIPVHEEEAALGAAIHGAVAAGVYRDYRDARGVIRYE
jgi:sedoheptulokinase